MQTGGRPLIDERNLRGPFLLLLAIAISLVFFRMIQSFVLALLLAAVLAGLAHPSYGRVLKKVKGRKSLAAAVTMLLGLVLVIAPLMLLMTIVAGEAAEISAAARPWIDYQIEHSGEWEQRLAGIPLVAKLAPYREDILAKAGELGGKAANFAVTGLASGTRGTAKFFVLLFMMLYGMFFFLQEGATILDRALHYVPISDGDKRRMLETFTTVSRASLKGTAIIGLIQGALGGVAFAVVGIPGPVFWGLMMAVLSVLPGVGPAIIWVPAVIYLAVEGQLGPAIGLGLWCLIVVSTIDNFLRPWLVGKDTKMPDLLVLLGTLGGLVLFGAVGIIIGPIIAALFVTIWELFGAAVEQTRKPSEQTGAETAS